MKLRETFIGAWVTILSSCILCAYDASGATDTEMPCSSSEEKFICSDDKLREETLTLKRLLSKDSSIFSSLPNFQEFEAHRQKTCARSDSVAPSEETRRCYLAETNRRMDVQQRAHRLKEATYPETRAASISIIIKEHPLPAPSGLNTPRLRIRQTELSAFRPNGIESPIHPPLSNFRCLEYVDVLEGEDSIPTHSLTSPSEHSWNCSLGTPVNEDEMKDPDIVAMTDFNFISLTDYNFDGYLDVEVVDMAESGPTHTRAHVYIYDPSTKHFVLNTSLEKISAPIIDQEHKRIRSDKTYEEGTLGTILSYRYNDGSFILSEEETRERLSDHCIRTLGCTTKDARPTCSHLQRCTQQTTALCPAVYVKEIKSFSHTKAIIEKASYRYELDRDGKEIRKSDSVICPTE